MRGLFTDKYNSLSHFIFGLLTLYFPYIFIFYLFYQFNDLQDVNLKIDIDGSEILFLKGAVETLKSKNLKGIIFELNEVDPNFENIISILDTNGFVESERYSVPNEPSLFNIIFKRK